MSDWNGHVSAVARVIHRVWISAAGGHDPLFPSFTCGAAGPQRGGPVSRPHTRVSEDGTRLPDSPARADGLGWVYRSPQPPQELHPHFCPVRVPGSCTAGNIVSATACVRPSIVHHHSLDFCVVLWQETPAQQRAQRAVVAGLPESAPVCRPGTS